MSAIHLLYPLAGAWLGVVFIKSEVVSWFRIQEMFRFQSFHMYGVIGTALLVASVGLAVIRATRVRSLTGEPIDVRAKQMTATGTRYWLGGAVFGLGWGLLGACPGPMFALLGAGVAPIGLAILSAAVGTWTYGLMQSRLPH